MAIFMLLLLIGFEMLLGLTLGNMAGDTRYVRLRENAANLNWDITPSPAEMSLSDNLEKKTYQFNTDENGFLLPSLEHENADYTIAFIGGSTTENMYVDTQTRFTHLVSKTLTTSQFKVNTINAGVSGNDSLNSINAYLNKIVPLKPEMAVLMHNVNDLSILLHEGSYWNDNYYRSPIIDEDKSLKSYVKNKIPNTYELLYRLVQSTKGPIDEFSRNGENKQVIDEEKIYNLFEENLNVFVAISKAKKIKPVLMTQASRFKEEPDALIKNTFQNLKGLGIDYPQYKKLYDGLNERIRKVATQNNITLIDLDKVVPQTNEYLYDPVHLNDKGSVLVAKTISQSLKEVIKAN